MHRGPPFKLLTSDDALRPQQGPGPEAASAVAPSSTVPQLPLLAYLKAVRGQGCVDLDGLSAGELVSAAVTIDGLRHQLTKHEEAIAVMTAELAQLAATIERYRRMTPAEATSREPCATTRTPSAT